MGTSISSSRCIQKRGSRYYFRLKIPADLCPLFPSREFVRSLRTTSFGTARYRAVSLEARLLGLFVFIRDQFIKGKGCSMARMLNRDDIGRLVAEHFNDVLEQGESVRAEMGRNDHNLEAGVEITQDLLIENELMPLEEAVLYNDLKRAAPYADEALEKHSLEANKEGPEYKRLCRDILKARLKAQEIELDRWRGDYSINPSEAFSLLGMSSGVVPSNGPLASDSKPTPSLSSAIEQFIENRGQSWAPRTTPQIDRCLTLFLQVVGDKALGSAAKDDIRRFREFLMKLPKRTGRKVFDEGQITVEAVLKRPAGSDLKAETINRELTHLSSFFSFTMDEGWLSENPVNGMKLRKKKSEDDSRLPFSDANLQAIFNNSYKGLRDARPDRYWIPLICLYTGARHEEIASLNLDDIQEVDGVWCISIHGDEDGRSVKTKSSKRYVPIHSFLIQHGFLAYCEERRDSGEKKAFPNLSSSVKGAGSAAGSWFRRWIREEAEIKDPRIVGYSTRHTFITRLKYLDVQEATIAELVGHVNPNLTTGHYGKKLEVKKLKEAIEKLDLKEQLDALL